MSEVVLREATLDDITGIARIYAHHVARSVACFEEVPPDEDEMRARILKLLERRFPQPPRDMAEALSSAAIPAECFTVFRRGEMRVLAPDTKDAGTAR